MEASAIETKPPYGGFRTFWNFIGQLHEDRPLPQVLDKAVMGSRGGSARTELYTALRFFHLIDKDKRPTPTLQTLSEDPSAEALRSMVEERYAEVIALDLATATPSQVGQKLAELGSTPSTIDRARTFFLNAAEESGIEVGKLLKTARAPSTPRRRSPRSRKPATPPPSDAKQLPTVVQGLVERLPAAGEEWSAEEAEEWLELARPAFAFEYRFKYGNVGGP